MILFKKKTHFDEKLKNIYGKFSSNGTRKLETEKVA